MEVDCLVMSASRPWALKKCLDSFSKFVKCERHTLRFLLHEAYILYNKSDECLDIAKEFGRFDIIKCPIPFLRFGPSLGYMVDNFISSDFMFLLLDDYEFIRDVDLDVVLDLMIAHKGINQIGFSRRDLGPGKFEHKNFYFDNVPLTVGGHWVFTQCIWRMNFIKPSLRYTEGSPHWATNHALKERLNWKFKESPTPSWVYEHQGTYFWGSVGDNKYVNCTATAKPMRALTEGYRHEPSSQWVAKISKEVKRQGRG